MFGVGRVWSWTCLEKVVINYIGVVGWDWQIFIYFRQSLLPLALQGRGSCQERRKGIYARCEKEEGRDCIWDMGLVETEEREDIALQQNILRLYLNKGEAINWLLSCFVWCVFVLFLAEN